MIGRRTAVCLSLLCALVFCAFAAQSGFAAAAKNTTAVTCEKQGGNGAFSDAHCDTNVGEGKGEYGHVAIAVGTETSVTVSNAKTLNSTTEAAKTVLKGTIFGIKNEITCNTVEGSGTLTNKEPEAKVHTVEGTIEAKFTKCTVNKPAGFGCKAKEPITVKSNVKAVEELGAGKNEMGLEFSPSEGKVFASVTIESCFLAGTYNTEGTAIATSNTSNTGKFTGATSVFTNAMTKETLTLAGNPAEVSSTTTVTMSGAR